MRVMCLPHIAVCRTKTWQFQFYTRSRLIVPSCNNIARLLKIICLRDETRYNMLHWQCNLMYKNIDPYRALLCRLLIVTHLTILPVCQTTSRMLFNQQPVKAFEAH